MTKEQLKTIVKNSIDYCVYCAGILDNDFLSKRDVEDVAKPIATLAVLNGFMGYDYGIGSYSDIMGAYLKSLSLVTRIEGSYIEEMKELINDQYNKLLSTVRDDDNLDRFDLTVVIDDLLKEAKQ